MKKSTAFALFMIFIVAFGGRLYWASQKKGVHIDETLSVVLSSYNDFCWKKPYPQDQAFSGREIKEQTLWNDASISGALKDVAHLWWNNRDKAHSNYYYTLLRLWFTGVRTGDFQTILYRGIGLQLLLFSLSFLSFLLLVRKLFHEPGLIMVGMVAAFWSAASISNTLLLREYQLQELMLILLAHVFVDFYRKMDAGNPLSGWILNWKSIAIVSLTLLSGYFTIAMVVFLLGALILRSMWTAQCSNIRFLMGIGLLGGFFANVLYVRFLSGFVSSRASQALGGGSVVESLQQWGILLELYTFHGVLLAVLLISVSIWAVLRKQRLGLEFRPVLLLVVLSLVWSMVAMVLAPYKMLRYVVSAYPLIALAVPLLLARLKGREQIAALLVIASGLGFYSLQSARIETLYNEFPAQQVYQEHPGLPVFVSSKTLWKNASIVPYFSDLQEYRFFSSDSVMNLRLQGIGSAYVLKEGGSLAVPGGFKILETFPCGHYFTGYRLVRAVD